MKRAFSLVELMIVVALLGILAAMTLPAFQGHVTEAKETAAKDNLHTLRAAIELYAAQHNDTPPGYLNDNLIPAFTVYVQFTSYTNKEGQPSTVESEDHRYGPYLKKIPTNPLNDKYIMRILTDGESFPDSADGSFGWIYKPATKTIKLDYPGTDKYGVRFYDY